MDTPDYSHKHHQSTNYNDNNLFKYATLDRKRPCFSFSILEKSSYCWPCDGHSSHSKIIDLKHFFCNNQIHTMHGYHLLCHGFVFHCLLGNCKIQIFQKTRVYTTARVYKHYGKSNFFQKNGKICQP